MTESPPRTGTTRLVFGGDVMLARRINEMMRAGRAPEAYWGDVLPNLAAADAVIANLECPITTTSERWPGFKLFKFQADPAAMAILAAGHVACVALANNHMLDCNLPGMFDTIRRLDEAGLPHSGAGENFAAAIKPAVFRAGGLTIGFASITDQMKPFAAGKDRPGTAFVRPGLDDATLGLVARLAQEMATGGANFRVLSIHRGPNFRYWPPESYRRFCRRAIELGFDLIHGHSAHIFHGVEFHGDGLILYDTGDFLEEFFVIPGLRTDRSLLFEVEVGAAGPPRLTLSPLSLTYGETNFAVGSEAEAIRDAMVRRCRGFAVKLERWGAGFLASPAFTGSPLSRG